jgi:hypothetical protein
MAAAPWSSPLQANVFIWIVTKGGDSLFIDPLAEQLSCETMTANPLSGAEPTVPLSARRHLPRRQRGRGADTGVFIHNRRGENRAKAHRKNRGDGKLAAIHRLVDMRCPWRA